jgi:hypothetical protein
MPWKVSSTVEAIFEERAKHTQSSKVTIRQKDGDGAMSTKFLWTCLIAQRLNSVQFHAIIEAMLSTRKHEDCR